MGKFFFVIFVQENFGVQFLPEGSTPQWEGGAAGTICAAGLCTVCLPFFSGDTQGITSIFSAPMCTHLCMCLCLFMQATTFALI